MEKNTKTQKAIAIKYDKTKIAPEVVAKGSGLIAENIIKKSKTSISQIPIYKDPILLEQLSKIDIGDNIPPELYEIVAQVLIFISDLDKNRLNN